MTTKQQDTEPTGLDLASLVAAERTFTLTLNDKAVQVRYNPAKFDGAWTTLAPTLGNWLDIYRKGLTRLEVALNGVPLTANALDAAPIPLLRAVYNAIGQDVYTGE